MTDQDRDKLIEQARRDLDMAAWDDDTATMSAVRDLIDAAWRPPPSGDAIEQAARVLDPGAFGVIQWDSEWTRRHFEERRDAARATAQGLADACLLATPQACDGSEQCRARPHTHGCFADRGDCGEPSEHATPAQQDADITRAARALHHHGACTCEGLTGCREDVGVVLAALRGDSPTCDGCPACEEVGSDG